MHIQRLKLFGFRNLKEEFEIAFDASAPGPDGKRLDFRSHAVIGHNGSGKSNLIEADHHHLPGSRPVPARQPGLRARLHGPRPRHRAEGRDRQAPHGGHRR